MRKIHFELQHEHLQSDSMDLLTVGHDWKYPIYHYGVGGVCRCRYWFAKLLPRLVTNSS